MLQIEPRYTSISKLHNGNMNNYLYRLDLPTQISHLSIEKALGLTQCAIMPKTGCVEAILEAGISKQFKFEDLDFEEALQAMQDDDLNFDLRNEMGEEDYAKYFPLDEIRRRHEEVLFRLVNESEIQFIDHCGIMPSTSVLYAYNIDISVVKLSFQDFIKFANTLKIGVFYLENTYTEPESSDVKNKDSLSMPMPIAVSIAVPVQRSAVQDIAILAELKRLGVNPLEIPENPPGRPGVKAVVRISLKSNKFFYGNTIFDKAWLRLKNAGDIVIIEK